MSDKLSGPKFWVHMFEHETIDFLAVQVDEDFNTRKFKLGDIVAFKVIGIEHKGRTEGVRVI